jgi:hypothetical protein
MKEGTRKIDTHQMVTNGTKRRSGPSISRKPAVSALNAPWSSNSPALKSPWHDRRSLRDIQRLEPKWPASFAQAQVTDVAK